MTKITILTGGSRGDVQPYVALGKGLQAHGYDVSILATDDFKTLITDARLNYISAGANVQNIIQGEEWLDLVESGNFLAIQAKMRQEQKKHAPHMAQKMIEGSQGADLLIGGMPALGGGFSIAQKTGTPILNAHVFPLTPTDAISSPVVPNLPFGKRLNRLSLIITQQMLWQTLRTSDNAVREQLNMPKGSFWGPYKWLDEQNVPTIYGFSRHVIPKPSDWDENTHVVGYWYLDAPEHWQAPQDLLDFLDAGEPPVYIGFGSMRSKDAEQASQLALDALSKAGQRGVLASGWGGMSPSDVPDSVHMLSSIPHSWLFPRMKAVVHHGGAGTTAAGLRAGVPTIITPFFGDQPFWGKCVHDLGVGSQPIPRKQLTADNLAAAIQQMTSDRAIQENAAALGEKIRVEDSITPVVQVIEGVMQHEIIRL